MDKIRIYRLDATTDTVNTDFLEFNDDVRGKDTKIQNAFIRKIIKQEIEGIGDNQSAEADLGDKQALGAVENKLIIEGFITQRNASGGNSFLLGLDIWSGQPKQTINWPEGNFGLFDLGDPTNDIVPVRTGTNQIGLTWESLVKTSILDKNQVDFVLTFTISEGDGN